jgi:hypothetical protein
MKGGRCRKACPILLRRGLALREDVAAPDERLCPDIHRVHSQNLSHNHRTIWSRPIRSHVLEFVSRWSHHRELEYTRMIEAPSWLANNIASGNWVCQTGEELKAARLWCTLTISEWTIEIVSR